jgi:hypothetical protein
MNTVDKIKEIPPEFVADRIEKATAIISGVVEYFEADHDQPPFFKAASEWLESGKSNEEKPSYERHE